VYGARPLKRLIQREVVDRVAKAVIEGRVREGDTVALDIENGEYALKGA
jgi:ATP-dependent Clp protease ATP-binding subunit ClpB